MYAGHRLAFVATFHFNTDSNIPCKHQGEGSGAWPSGQALGDVAMRWCWFCSLHLSLCLFGLGAATPTLHCWPASVPGVRLLCGGARCLSAWGCSELQEPRLPAHGCFLCQVVQATILTSVTTKNLFHTHTPTLYKRMYTHALTPSHLFTHTKNPKESIEFD